MFGHSWKINTEKEEHDETQITLPNKLRRESQFMLRPFVYCTVLFHETSLFKYQAWTSTVLFSLMKTSG